MCLKWSFDQNKLIEKYLASCPNNLQPNHRGSIHFDYFYAYSKLYDSPADLVASEAQTEQTALWLTSYLAHWGMFRGSSQLKNTNFLFFKDLVNKLLNANSGVLVPLFDLSFEKIQYQKKKDLDQTLAEISSVLKNGGISATPTLVSKIILGLTHTIPGYDRFFISGLKKLREDKLFTGPVNFSSTSLIELSKWYTELSWTEVKCSANQKFKLPPARLIDMAINQYGR